MADTKENDKLEDEAKKKGKAEHEAESSAGAGSGGTGATSNSEDKNDDHGNKTEKSEDNTQENGKNKHEFKPKTLEELQANIANRISVREAGLSELQPPLDGVTLNVVGDETMLSIRGRITNAEVDVLNDWIKQNKTELALSGRGSISAISISTSGGVKVKMDEALANSLNRLGIISTIEYRSGSIEIDPNFETNPLLKFDNLKHVHVWGGGLGLDFERNGRVVNPFNETHGLAFSFGTQEGKYDAEKKAMSGRVTHITGLSGIDSTSLVQTGAGAGVLDENAVSEQLVDLAPSAKEYSLDSVQRGNRAVVTSYEKDIEYRKTLEKLVSIPASTWAAYSKDNHAFDQWRQEGTDVHKALDYFAKAQDYKDDDKGTAVEKLLAEMSKSLSKALILNKDLLEEHFEKEEEETKTIENDGEKHKEKFSLAKASEDTAENIFKLAEHLTESSTQAELTTAIEKFKKKTIAEARAREEAERKAKEGDDKGNNTPGGSNGNSNTSETEKKNETTQENTIGTDESSKADEEATEKETPTTPAEEKTEEQNVSTPTEEPRTAPEQETPDEESVQSQEEEMSSEELDVAKMYQKNNNGHPVDSTDIGADGNIIHPEVQEPTERADSSLSDDGLSEDQRELWNEYDGKPSADATVFSLDGKPVEKTPESQRDTPEPQTENEQVEGESEQQDIYNTNNPSADSTVIKLHNSTEDKGPDSHDDSLSGENTESTPVNGTPESSAPETPKDNSESKEKKEEKVVPIPERNSGDLEKLGLKDFVNTDKLAWLQKIEQAEDSLYIETKNTRDKEPVQKTVARLSDKQVFIASNERDLNYKVKNLTKAFGTNELDDYLKQIEKRIEKAEEVYNEHYTDYNKHSDINDPQRPSIQDKLLEAEKKLESLQKEKALIDTFINSSKEIHDKQKQSIAESLYSQFVTAKQMDDDSVGKYFVNNGSMSFDEASLAGSGKEIINDAVTRNKMLVEVSKKIFNCVFEFHQNPTDFAKLGLTEKEKTELDKLKAKKTIGDKEKARIKELEAKEKLSVQDDNNPIEKCKKDIAEDLVNLKNLHAKVETARQEAEAAFIKAFNDKTKNGEINIAKIRKEIEENEIGEDGIEKVNGVIAKQEAYDDALSDLAKQTADLTNKVKAFFTDLEKDLGKSNSTDSILHSLGGKDGVVFADNGETILPMELYNNLKFFEALADPENRHNTLIFGQGSQFKHGSLSGTDIEKIVEKTDAVYLKEYEHEKAQRENAIADIRASLDSIFSIIKGEETSSKGLSADDWAEKLNSCLGNNPSANSAMLRIIKKQLDALDRNQAWLNYNCSFDDYVALQSRKGVELKNEWEKRVAERSAAYAQGLPQEELNKYIQKCNEAQQEYEDFKKDRKSELHTGFARNSKITLESGNFSFQGKNVNEGNRAEEINIQKPGGSTYEITGSDDEVKGLTGSQYVSACWRRLKNGVKSVVFGMITGFSNLSVAESIMQILLGLALMAHQIIKVPARALKYMYSKNAADTAAAKRAVLGFALEDAFEVESDEKGKVTGLKIKDGYESKLEQAGVEIDKEGHNFRVNLSKVSDNKFSGEKVLSFNIIPNKADAELIKKEMAKLKRKEQENRDYVNKYENEKVDKKTKIEQTVSQMKSESEEAEKKHTENINAGKISNDSTITSKGNISSTGRNAKKSFRRSKNSSRSY